jgi:type IV pilus assembly protein PilC
MSLSVYAYEGRNQSGTPVVGKCRAYQREDAMRVLREHGIAVTTLEQKKAEAVVGDSTIELDGPMLALFYRQLQAMLSAGVPLPRALATMRAHTREPHWVAVCSTLELAVRRGQTLAEACALFPLVFGAPHIAMLRAAERGGLVPDVLRDLCAWTEQAIRVQRKIREVSMYPAFILLTAIVTVLALVHFSMPQIVSLAADLNTDLPLITYLVQAVASTLSTLLLLGAVLGMGLWFCSPAVRRRAINSSVRHLLDRGGLLRLIARRVSADVALLRALRLLGPLLGAGVHMPSALMLSARVDGSPELTAALEHAAGAVRFGQPLAQAMGAHGKIFSRQVVAYIEAGETSGRLPYMIGKACENIELDTKVRLATLPAVIEPLCMLFLGTVVAIILLSVLVPLYGALGNL